MLRLIGRRRLPDEFAVIRIVVLTEYRSAQNGVHKLQDATHDLYVPLRSGTYGFLRNHIMNSNLGWAVDRDCTESPFTITVRRGSYWRARMRLYFLRRDAERSAETAPSMRAGQQVPSGTSF